MATQDYLKEVNPGVNELGNPESSYSIKDFEGKDFIVKTVKGQSNHLCGYDLHFWFKTITKADGSRAKVGKRYELRAEDFPMWKVDAKGKRIYQKDKSLLPEIMFKLTRDGNKVIDVIDIVPAGTLAEREREAKLAKDNKDEGKK